MIDLTQRIAAGVLSFALLLVILELVRRKRLQERYALLWLLTSAVLLVLVAWRGLLTTLALKVGIHYPPSALFAVALGFQLLLLLHFSLAVSRLSDQNKVLAQRLGLLQQRLEEHQALLLERTKSADRAQPGGPEGDLVHAGVGTDSNLADALAHTQLRRR
jgi:hypothetical protein